MGNKLEGRLPNGFGRHGSWHLSSGKGLNLSEMFTDECIELSRSEAINCLNQVLVINSLVQILSLLINPIIYLATMFREPAFLTIVFFFVNE